MLSCFYQKFALPLLFLLPPEEAHHLAHWLIKYNRQCGELFKVSPCPPELSINFFGQELDNPIGLAAGFDKNGDLADSITSLGFGFMEVGSVCARPTAGNPKPRLFRLPEDKALINRLGLNGHGVEQIASALSRQPWSLPLGINIARTNIPGIAGKLAIEDVGFTFNRIKDLPVLYFVLNASCPNTHDGCMREIEELQNILEHLKSLNTNTRPLLIKLSPDSSDEFLEQITGLSKHLQLAGYICGNTTTRRDALKTASATIAAIGSGGLSGAPLKTPALALIRRIKSLKTDQEKIIASGGIFTGSDAWDCLSAGADIVQIYSALIYRGPTAVTTIGKELLECIRSSGFTSMQEAITGMRKNLPDSNQTE